MQRFKGVDPLAADYASVSPYNYVLGNPVLLTDPDGRAPQWPPVNVGWEVVKAWTRKNIFNSGGHDYAAAQAQYNADNSSVGLLGEVDGNFGNQNTTESLQGFAGNAATVMDFLMLADGVSSRTVTPFSPSFKALSGLSKSETMIAKSAAGILDDDAFKAGIDGMKNGTNSEATINGVNVVFQADGPFSGLTLFGENGFVVGKEALKSQTETSKTVLHEMHRLKTSASKTRGVSQSMITQETKTVADFADRAFNALNN